MIENTLPIIEAIDEITTDNRRRLQKSLRGGLLNVVKSIDKLSESFAQQIAIDREQLKEQTQKDDSAELEMIEERRENERNREKKSSFLSKAVSATGKVGLGGSALLAGAGILAGGSGLLLKQINELDGENIKEQVGHLLSISDDFEGGDWKFLVKGGAFFLAMTGIGAGLAVFAVGNAVAGAADYFTSDTWAQSIKDNVSTLLSINEEGGNGALLKNAGAFTTAMIGIGAGLAVFGAGTAVAGAADYFTSDTWAQSIKDNVATLLSITEADGDLKFLKKGGEFFLSMTGIGAGLAVFGAGGALSAGVDRFVNPDWSKDIKENVSTLLSIGSDIDKSNVDDLEYTLGKLGKVLSKFAGSQFFSNLKSAGASLFDFMDKPLNEVVDLADKSREITAVSKSLDQLAASLAKSSKIKFDFKDTFKSVPFIETAIAGGRIHGESGRTMFVKGLASPEINFELATQRISELRNVLSHAEQPHGAGGIAGTQIAVETREIEVSRSNQAVSNRTVVAPTNINTNSQTKVNNTTVAAASPLNLRSRIGGKRGIGDLDF